METLKGETVKSLDLKTLLIRVVDVLNYEGPLVSLFLNFKNYEIYLFDWSDKDKKANRWLIYRCQRATLNKLLEGEISYFDLMMSDEPFCYSVEIDSDQNWLNFLKIAKKDLPTKYIPSKDSFFDVVDCPDFNKLNVFVKSTPARSTR